jgi:alpha-mannosidase
MNEARRPLWFTFGNHMHWVDMQWLWGYQVLPDSVDDMLALCAAVGARGNLNFDAVGYEKLAAEDPAALERLRAAVAAGTVEVVGASYGQPYGLFQGGESNVRQRIFGARTVRRLLGVWPRTFWEEEFDCFPQLPQILAGCGFTGASLFFQWTWHTPSVPEEEVPLVHWEGIDGTRLPAIAKTALCLHQWPEDFDGKLELALAAARPALVQWLELMPSPDWMCRSEVLLPRLRELFADPRFAVRAVTLGRLIEALDDGSAPVRRYTMDDLFHGMTIGKNADAVPRRSDAVEARILAAEALTATLGLCGRPYASWDVHPAWELDEAWRELLQAQHHDNHECEALCGAVGKVSFDRAAGLAAEVLRRGRSHLAHRVAVDEGEALLVQNPLGWTRDVFVPRTAMPAGWDEVGAGRIARAVPAFGWTIVRRDDPDTAVAPRVEAVADRAGPHLRSGDLTASVDPATGVVQLGGAAGLRAGALSMRSAGAPFDFGPPTTGIVEHAGEPAVAVRYRGPAHEVEVRVRLRPECGGVELRTLVDALPRPDGGFGGALRLRLDIDGRFDLLHDTPFAIDRIEARGTHTRKYPSGDWMTSPQWFETVRGAFTARSLVDIDRGDGAGGLLCVHDGCQGWFRTAAGLEVVLNAYDPWDEDHWQERLSTELLLIPHRPGMTLAERHRRAAEARALLLVDPAAPRSDAHLPATFGGLDCAPSQVVVTAFHREHRHAFEHLEHGFGPDVRNPFVVRLVEFDGTPAEVELRVPGPCPRAARTDLLGTVLAELQAEPAEPPAWSPPGLSWSVLRFRMRAREIATLMLDLELGRHQPRNLDQHRRIWATVHRR